jgi:hypothetical protein
MANHVLIKIADAVADVLKGLSPKLKIKTPLFECEFDLAGLTALRIDRDALEITLDRCFIRRRLYVASLDMESLHFALLSALEIKEMLDKRADELSGQGGDHRHILDLLLPWASRANSLVQVLRDRQRPEPAFVKDDQQSSEALMNFRREVLPIIGVLIVQLDEGPTKTAAEEVYATATTSVVSARDVSAIAAAVSALSP